MKLHILPLIFLSTGYIAKAQQDTTTIIPIQEIIVTSQRNPQQSSLIPYSVSSLERNSMDALSPRTTPEALMSVNGVFVQKTNHGGGSPFFRGLTGNQTLLMIDGIRLNNSIYRYGPNQYLNTIDALGIEKMEVAKGTGSVQYGTDAIGGVLQMFTKEPVMNQNHSTVHGKVFGKYMSRDMEKTGRGELIYSSPKYAAMVGVTYHDFGDLIGGKATGKQSPSGYKEMAFDAKVTSSLRSNIQLTLAHQFLRQQHVPIYHKVVLENYQLSEFAPQQHMLTYARLNIRGKGNLFNQVRVIASWQNSQEGRLNQKKESNLLVSERDQVNTLGWTVDIHSKLSPAWTANSGIEIYQDQVGSTRIDQTTTTGGLAVQKRGLYPDNSKYGNYSVFSLQHFNVGRWIIDGGMRLNAFRIKISDPTLGEVEISPEALVFNTAVMYNIHRSHHVYGTISSGFRAPNIDDMGTLGIVDFRYEVPAYDLKPEKSINYELGYKLNLCNFNGTMSAYYMDLNQLITRVKEEGRFIDGYQVYRKENVEEAYIQGLEASFNWKVMPSFDLSSGISFTYGQSITKDEPLRRIPPLNGRTAGTYRFRNVFATAEFMFASKQDRLADGDKSDNRIPQGGTPGWQVFNLYTGIDIASLKLLAGLQNIGNADYRTHGSGINGIGRSIFVSVGYSF